MKPFRQILEASEKDIEDQIKKADGLSNQMGIVFNMVKKGKMDRKAFENIVWKIYNNKL